MTGALQSVAIVAVFGAVAWVAQAWCFPSDAPKRLGPGFVDETPEAKRWAEELSPKEPARLRGGTR